MLVLGLNLPLPLSLGVLQFNRQNISTFLEQYMDIYKDYYIPNDIKRERIIRYISQVFKEQIKAILEYYINNPKAYQENKFFKVLLKEFQETNQEIIRVSRDYFSRIIIRAKVRGLSTKSYIDIFNRVSKELVRKKELDEIT